MESSHLKLGDVWEGSNILSLPGELREEMKAPLGIIVPEEELLNYISDAANVVTIGDLCTLTLYGKGMIPDIAIVDYKTRRGEVKELKKQLRDVGDLVKKVVNPPGTLTRELWLAVKEAYMEKKKTRIEVEGEEDIAALPCVWLAPRRTTIIYGLPGKGLVVVKNAREDEEVRMKVGRVLIAMKSYGG